MKYLAYGLIGGCAVAVAVWLAERVGGKTGGVIATAPTVVLVAYVLFCGRHGVEKSNDFAWGSVRGVVATGIFMLVLGIMPASVGMLARLAVASVAWLATAFVLVR